MKYGLFMMPNHPPERNIYDSHQWDLDYLELADDFGYHEAWIGEHFTSPWEPIPSPDLMIAQALMRTKQIKLAPGAHLLPFHHPAELAHRVAYLDHIAQGRFMFGVGASGLPTDWALFNVDGMSGQHRDMTRESLEIILKIWENKGPFEYKGKYWNIEVTDTMYDNLKFFLTPYQKPHPPIGIASLSYKSPSLIMAGENGFLPLTLALNTDFCKSHWEAVEEGARKSGKTPSRNDWRVVRDVYIADTDEEARAAAVDGMTGRMWNEYLLRLFKEFDLMSVFKHDPEMPDDAVDIDYLADNMWLIGSPETVTNKLRKLYKDIGGFGCLLVLVYDHWQNQEGWEKSTRLLAEEVMPDLADLVPA
jgi:alkanesulfonate monooxygenase SsuD/methylene tetrahydromethanopterin reductase-like flavin-dependent oxidoreductase (luciferase family)